jgi:phenylacetate-CoA ligase
VFPTQIEEQLLRVPGLTPHYVCVLTRPGRLDELTIRVEAHAASAGARTKEAMAEQLASLVKSHVGITVDVDVVEPHALERSIGKAKRIDDRRQLRKRP